MTGNFESKQLNIISQKSSSNVVRVKISILTIHVKYFTTECFLNGKFTAGVRKILIKRERSKLVYPTKICGIMPWSYQKHVVNI